jgi:hypothetical protein
MFLGATHYRGSFPAGKRNVQKDTDDSDHNPLLCFFVHTLCLFAFWELTNTSRY